MGVMAMLLKGPPGTTPLPTANLVAHWDANLNVYKDAGSTPAVNGDTVQQWNEQVSGNNFAQATAGSRPKFLTNQTNGYPAVQLDTTTKKLISTGFTPANANTYLVCAVVNFASFVNNGDVFQSGDGNDRELHQTGTAPQLKHYNGGTDSNAFNGPSVGTWALLQITWTTGGNQYAVNNASFANMGSSSGVGNGWNGFAYGGPGNFSALMSMAQLAIYSPIPTGSAYTDIINYFKARYGYW